MISQTLFGAKQARERIHHYKLPIEKIINGTQITIHTHWCLLSKQLPILVNILLKDILEVPVTDQPYEESSEKICKSFLTNNLPLLT